MNSKFTFGPVPSRRLGFSLGIDIIPLKTCTYNCVYCQLFQTSNYAYKRQTYFDPQLIISDIKEAVKNASQIDFLTFSGSGEPTLNKDLGLIINEVKSFTDKPVAVITNGSLLWMPDVQKDLKQADLVVPSLDCINSNIWLKLNRPDSNINIKQVLDGIKDFCKNHKGKIWLEIMITKKINDTQEEIKTIAEFVNNLKVDRVQLNTVVRPPNESFAQPVTEEFLKSILPLFTTNTEIIAPFNKVAGTINIDNKEQIIIDLLTRRPCKPQEMADSLGFNLNEIAKSLQKLVEKGEITRQSSGFYSLKD